MTTVDVRVNAYCSEDGKPIRYRVQWEFPDPRKDITIRSGAPYERIEDAAPPIQHSLALFSIENREYKIILWEGNYPLEPDGDGRVKPREHTKRPSESIRKRLLSVLKDSTNS